MAIVGEASIIVRAITSGVAGDIRRGLSAAEPEADKAGKKVTSRFTNTISEGLARIDSNLFNLGGSFKKFGSESAGALKEFRGMLLQFYKLGAIIPTVIGLVGSLVGGIISLIGVAAQAAPAVVGLGGAMVQLGIGAIGAKLAFGGIMKSVQSAIAQQQQLTSAAKNSAKTLRDLRYAGEEAVFSERRAALNLEKAREGLQRVQDLPPNSRAAREAALSYEEAELAYRKSKDAAIDAAEAAKRGSKVPLNDPYANLTPSQKEFAKFIVSLQDKFKELKEAVAKGFLPVLQTQIERVTSAFNGKMGPALEGLGKSLGTASKNFTDGFLSNGNVDKIIKLIENAGPTIESFGKSAGLLFGDFLDILIAAEPLTKRLVGWLEKLIGKFDTFIKKASADGSLEKFFNDAGDAASNLKTIFGNVFDGLSDMLGTAVGPGSGGEVMTNWLKEITGNFAAFTDNPDNKGKMKSWFKLAAENFTVIADSIGKIASALFGVDNQTATSEFLKGFQDAIPGILDFIKKFNNKDNGKVLGELFKTIVDIFNLVVPDTKGTTTFFTIILDAAKALKDFLSQPWLQSFIKEFGPASAAIVAFGQVFKGIKFGANVAFGALNQLLSPITGIYGFFTIKDGPSKFTKTIKSIGDTFTTLRLEAMYAKDGIKKGFDTMGRWSKVAASGIGEAAKAVGGFTKNLAINAAQGVKTIASWVAQKTAALAMKTATLVWNGVTKIAAGVQAAFNAVMALNPVTLIVIAILALVAALIWFFTQTKLGQDIWSGFVGVLTDSWNNFVTLFQSTMGFLGEFFTVFGTVISNIWNGIVTFFSTTFTSIGSFFNTVFSGIGTFFAGIGSGISTAWGIVVTFFSTTFTSIGSFFNTVFSGIGTFFAGIGSGIKTAWGIVVNYFSTTFTSIGSFFNTVFSGIGTFFAGIGSGIKTAWNIVVTFFKGTFTNISNWFNDAFGGLGKVVGGVVDTITGFFKNGVNGWISLLENFINFFIKGINGMLGGLNTVLDGIKAVTGGAISLHIPNIPSVKLPRLAKGGTVSPTSGGTLAVLAEAGRAERVEPLNSNGLSDRDIALIEKLSGNKSQGANISITVNPAPGMNERELANKISEVLGLQIRRGALN